METRSEWLNLYTQSLRVYYAEEAQEIFRRIFDVLWPADSRLWRMHLEKQVSPNEKTKLQHFLDELLKGRPIQYIIGKAWFGPLDLFVNENVLIPRPETEELCEWMLKENRETNLKVLDACTGSGCIPLYLKFFRNNWEIRGFDLSPGAITVAKQNVENLKLEVTFFTDDVCEPQHIAQNDYDILVSNPPYIPREEAEELRPHVIEHEPEMALFAPEGDALYFYRALEKLGRKCLKIHGQLWIEIHEHHAQETAELFTFDYWSEPKILNDIHGKSRFIFVRKRAGNPPADAGAGRTN